MRKEYSNLQIVDQTTFYSKIGFFVNVRGIQAVL